MRSSHGVVLAAAVLVLACKKAEVQEMVEANPAPPPGTLQWKLWNARTAAPANVSANATIMDVITSDTAEPASLVAGDNGWTCYPDNPGTEANDPFCLDEEGMRFRGAWMARRPPRLQGMAIAYLLQGGVSASDTDPFKTQPDSGQAWIVDPPLIAIAMPNARSYAGLPTTRRADGPWVKFAGTPYAHLVIPTARPGPTP